MTGLPETALSRASELPTKEQDALADWLLRELESEARWERLFAESRDSLGCMAADPRPKTPGAADLRAINDRAPTGIGAADQ